jgi:uncharacterized protein (TIGR00299 family) protein
MSRRSSTASERGRAPRRRSGVPASGARLLHLDTFSGIAGNMFLGALIDLGLAPADLERELAPLGLDFRLRVRRVRRGPLAARYVQVEVPAAKRGRGARATHGHRHPHGHGAAAEHATEHGRSFAEIRRLISRAKLAPEVRARSLAIFEALAGAEGRVHGVAPERVHFHEVGAVDAIVDVVGAAIGLERLGIERVSATPVALGGGSVDSEHGRLPVPAPATLELLRGLPTVPAHADFETVTPTGAAILRCVAHEFGPMPALIVERIGHGAGDARPSVLPNVLRAVLGRAGGLERDRIVCLETNLDDFVPEHFDHVMERLFSAGALDVSLQHLHMKKSRPGFLVRVLARPSERVPVARVLFAETTALGVRISECERLVLPREERRVRLPQGAIRVKVARGPEGSVEVSAEYEDCRRAALRSGTPLREVVRLAEAAARAELSKDPPSRRGPSTKGVR